MFHCLIFESYSSVVGSGVAKKLAETGQAAWLFTIIERTAVL